MTANWLATDCNLLQYFLCSCTCVVCTAFCCLSLEGRIGSASNVLAEGDGSHLDWQVITQQRHAAHFVRLP